MKPLFHLTMAAWLSPAAVHFSVAEPTPPISIGHVGKRSTCDARSNYTAIATHIGCYTDSDDRTLAFKGSGGSDQMTPQFCNNLCGRAGYTHSGTENGNECYCGNAIRSTASLVNASSCSRKCSGDSSQTCGAPWFVDIYQIDNPSDHPISFTLPDCTRDPLCSMPICDGSLSVGERVASLISNMTLEEKVSNLLNGAPGVPRLNLPGYEWWSEALHGVADSPGVTFEVGGNVSWNSATSFPMPILMGAAFDDSLIHKVATVIGREGRSFANNGHAGFDFWTPNINPFRDPRWGRGLETPGEDPFHLQNYVYNLITGLQGGVDPEEALVIATCKHFAVYDIETDRHSIDLNPTPQDLTDYYMQPFKTCARDAKAGAFMCSYNAVNGAPACANRYLLQTMLREHWGWSEPYHWVTSDCGAVADINENHNYTANDVAAAAAALNAGTDLGCEDSIETTLVEAVALNVTTEDTVDRALARLYSSLVRIGYFDAASSKYSSLGWKDVNTPEAETLAYEAAVEGMVLLKNDGLLPLPKDVSNVAVIGPFANATTILQGNYQGVAPYLISPFSAMDAKWDNVKYAAGTGIETNSTANFTAALNTAKEADYIIYCGGLDGTVEAESLDRTSIDWPGNQLDLVDQLASLNKKMVVVLFSGGQVDQSSILSDKRIGSLVWAGLPGQSGGKALADILDGTKSVAGRLPVTVYPSEYVNQAEMVDPALRPDKSTGNPGRTYKWFSDAVLPFGYGLHYTDFKVSWRQGPQQAYDISQLVESASEPKDRAASIKLQLEVKNIGSKSKMASDYVGMVYSTTKDAGPKPYPLKSLVAYGRLFDVAVGETEVLPLTIPLGAISRADENGNLVVYPGEYTLSVDTDGQAPVHFKLTGHEVIIDRVPVPPVDALPLSYVGCYSNANGTLLDGPVRSLPHTNTPQACAEGCATSGYDLSGVMGRKLCHCGTSLSTSSSNPSNESNCNLPCSGNVQAICGGVSYTSVFNNTPAVKFEPPTFLG